MSEYTSVYVGKLPMNITRQEMNEVFAPYRPRRIDLRHGKSFDFGFVEVPADFVDEVLQKMNRLHPLTHTRRRCFFSQHFFLCFLPSLDLRLRPPRQPAHRRGCAHHGCHSPPRPFAPHRHTHTHTRRHSHRVTRVSWFLRHAEQHMLQLRTVGPLLARLPEPPPRGPPRRPPRQLPRARGGPRPPLLRAQPEPAALGRQRRVGRRAQPPLALPHPPLALAQPDPLPLAQPFTQPFAQPQPLAQPPQPPPQPQPPPPQPPPLALRLAQPDAPLSRPRCPFFSSHSTPLFRKPPQADRTPSPPPPHPLPHIPFFLPLQRRAQPSLQQPQPEPQPHQPSSVSPSVSSGTRAPPASQPASQQRPSSSASVVCLFF